MNIKEQIEYAEFTAMESKLDIRIGTVIEAERVPKSEKLIKLTVQFGHEATESNLKTVVTNLGDKYTPDSFKLRKIPFIVNLTPFKLMGITSEAMIIPAKNDKGEIELDNYSSGSQLI